MNLNSQKKSQCFSFEKSEGIKLLTKSFVVPGIYYSFDIFAIRIKVCNWVRA